MARPHIEFIESDKLAWQPFPLWNDGGVTARILSEDDETGGCSLVLNFPANWQRDYQGYNLAAEEIFILNGDFTIDDTAYAASCYTYIPAGMLTHKASAGPNGCTILAMYDVRPRFIASQTPLPEVKADQYINFYNTVEMPWRGPHGDGEQPSEFGIMVKILREDPETHATSWMMGILPGWRENRKEVHPVVEESFKLTGDMLLGPRGLMTPGSYFWRPPGVEHGPLYTATGTMSFCRSSGKLSTLYQPVDDGYLNNLKAESRGAKFTVEI